MAILLFCVSAHAGVVNNSNSDLRPTGKGYGIAQLPLNSTSFANIAPAGANPKGPTGYGINYHGGPIINGTTNIYYIWYGNWSNNSAIYILENLASKIGGSLRYNINTTYSDANLIKVNPNVAFMGSIQFGYLKNTDNTNNTNLSDADILTVVNTAISLNILPNDPNGVYFVLTSKDVNEITGFTTQYCGWHSYANISGTNIKYSFVGDASSLNPSACEAQSVSPNGNPGADGMASVIVHELEESVTDPTFSGWYDKKGNENSDKCAWQFGTTTTLSSRAKYNMTLGGVKYLIQQNWVNKSPGYCAIKF